MLKLKPRFLTENGEKKFVLLTMKEFARISEALEDAEDARILDEAKRRSAGKPRYTLEQVKRELGIATRTRRKSAR